MREHQIVITLKPDQFLEVQRLARAANAKSMGIFVRQRLLAALGIEGTLPAEQTADGSAQDVETALVQVRRLHGELKTFVAESLSLYNLEMAEGGDEQAPAASPSVAPAAVAADSMESVAEKTFAISPRLGAIGETTPEAANEPPRHEPNRRDQHRYYHPHAASDLMDVPFRGADSGRGTPVINDPLDKLLPKDDEFKPTQSGESQAPPSLAERARQQAAARPAPVPAAPIFYFEDEEAVAPSPVMPEEPVIRQVALDEMADDNAPLESELPAADPEIAKPSVPRSHDYPSLSGSPPPKRRQL